MISIIIPFYNEEKNLEILYKKLEEVLKKIKTEHEIIFVDDGSTDLSRQEILDTTKNNEKVKVIFHKKRFGKGKALESGFVNSKGDLIILMDADMQNDPDDLPAFIDKIGEGFDLVNGYRQIRNDGLDKTFPSKIYNNLITRIFNVKLHDMNCGFKAMKREVLKSISLYGDNYRILPILAKNEGFKIAEITVTHHPRKYGVSKYGFWRMLFGFFDMSAHFFLLKYVEKPLHFFGVAGGFAFFIGMVILIYLGIERLLFQKLLYRRPILFLGILLVTVGMQIVLTGFIGELIVYLDRKRTKA